MSIFIFCYLMANNHLECGLFYKKIAKQAGDDEQIIDYEWPKYQCSYSNPFFNNGFMLLK